jgi:hypothetical protein
MYLIVWVADTSTGARIAIVGFKNHYPEVQRVINFSLLFYNYDYNVGSFHSTNASMWLLNAGSTNLIFEL